MNTKNGARIHASRITKGMRVKNIIRQPWETETTYDVDTVDSEVIEGVTIYAINDAAGNRHTNMHGYYAVVGVPTDGLVVEVGTLPLGAYVTVMGIYGAQRGHVTGPGIITGYDNELKTSPKSLAVVGEHYDATAALMLPIGPQSAA